MEGFDPSDSEQFRTGAYKVAEAFGLTSQVVGRGHTTPIARQECGAQSRQVPPPITNGVPVVNQPLNFELKNLDIEHPYLHDRDFLPETIQYFSLGYCNRGLMRGRVVIPLHNPRGELVGYAGRITEDAMISDACPKYRFPGDRERDGLALEFRKSLLLYNVHRISGPVDHIFVVEGFPAAWWLWQAKYRTTVALMGSSCSDEQGKLIVDLVKPDGKVWLMPDGNEAGIRCAHSVFERVAPHRFMRWVRIGDNEQPTDYPAEELTALFQ